MWFFVDDPWQYRILDQLTPGIDRAQLEQALRMTPTERLEAVIELMEIGEALRAAVAQKEIPQ